MLLRHLDSLVCPLSFTKDRNKIESLHLLVEWEKAYVKVDSEDFDMETSERVRQREAVPLEYMIKASRPLRK